MKKRNRSSNSNPLLAIATEEDQHDLEELESEYLLDTSTMQHKLAPETLSHPTINLATQSYCKSSLMSL